MKNSKNTKRALLLSVLSMMLCMAMLIGSTFAWFTDSVTSGKNKIVAGNLDVELYHTNGNVADEKVGETTNLFTDKEGNAILWEPGVMVYENFTVKNVGSLALKYCLTVNIGNFNTIDGKSLKDVLKVAIFDGAFTGDRATAQALTFDGTIADFEKSGNIAAGTADDTYAIVIYWEPTAADNDYNLNNGKVSSDGNPLFIELGVNLVATQDTVEEDSFGKDYDADAMYTVEVATVEEFTKAIKDGGNIVLKNDLTLTETVTVEAGTSVVLDMNGNAIRTPAEFSGRPITNYGDLTVTGNGIIDSSASEFGGYGAIRNDGNAVLTIQNGTFAGHVCADGSAIRNTATCIINGGDFTGTAAVYNEGTLTVNGGTFHTSSCNQTTDSKGGKNHWAYCINNHGNITFNEGTVTGVQGAMGVGGGNAVINGGTFTTLTCEHGSGPAFYAVYIAGETGNATATINGGTFKSASKQAIWVGNDNTNGDGGINAKATVEIKNGIFISNDGVDVMKTGPVTGTPKITGGTFSNDNVDRQNSTGTKLNAYIPEGYAAVQNDNGTWTVTPIVDEGDAQDPFEE